MESIYFKGVKVSVCNNETAAEEALRLSRSGIPSYVCVTDAGNIVNAVRGSGALRNAINGSHLSLPDGRPISAVASVKGIRGIARVTGADFMMNVISSGRAYSMRHFLLGDTDEIQERLANELCKRFGVRIAGRYSPPFSPLEEMDNDIAIRKIEDSGADFIWVSLGGGKQEIWMQKNHRRMSKGVMTGVGAAFRFITGDIKRAPVPLQNIGLEWLYRLLQQPGKMAGRYAGTLPVFLYYSIQELISNNIRTENK